MLLCATAQAQPYGIEERIPNQSLIISLQDEEPPLTISASGLYSDIATRTVAQGIIPFGVNAQLWSDGTYKERFIALPDTEKIRFSADSPWKFPPGSVLVKNFYLEFESGNAASRGLIETRFLRKRHRRRQVVRLQLQVGSRRQRRGAAGTGIHRGLFRPRF